MIINGASTDVKTSFKSPIYIYEDELPLNQYATPEVVKSAAKALTKGRGRSTIW
jgi:hypothetical protein